MNEAQIKKLLTGAIIAGIHQVDGDLIIYKQGASRNTAVKFSDIFGRPFKELTVISSYDMSNITVSTWMNSPELAPRLAKAMGQEPEVKETDVLKFIGRTILKVGVYGSNVKRGERLSISLQTGIPNLPDPKKPNEKPKPPKIETLAIGATVAK